MIALWVFTSFRYLWLYIWISSWSDIHPRNLPKVSANCFCYTSWQRVFIFFSFRINHWLNEFTETFLCNTLNKTLNFGALEAKFQIEQKSYQNSAVSRQQFRWKTIIIWKISIKNPRFSSGYSTRKKCSVRSAYWWNRCRLLVFFPKF